MKHIFIINPAAGKGRAQKLYLPMLEKLTKLGHINHEIHCAKPGGGTARLVAALCRQNGLSQLSPIEDPRVQASSGCAPAQAQRSCEDSLRFYACGGDGTLHEVINGIFGFEHVQAAVIPSGTGNDFVRNFTNQEYFTQIERQLKGEPVLIDAVYFEALSAQRKGKADPAGGLYDLGVSRISGIDAQGLSGHEADLALRSAAERQTQRPESSDGLCDLELPKISRTDTQGLSGSVCGLAVNMCNIGADSETAYRVQALKKYPLLTGAAAYLAALAFVFFGKLGESLRLTFDEGRTVQGTFLLMAAGNGRYCGGGFQAAPRASVCDGRMDICLVNQIAKAKIPPLIAAYRKGRHLTSAKLKQYVSYQQCEALTIESERPIRLCADGELYLTSWVRLAVLPRAVCFSVPLGSALAQKKVDSTP